MKYECKDCDMTVKGLTCGHCGSDLKHATVNDQNGKKIQVSECPKKCGKIKSPMCCGQDMQVVNE